MERIAEVVPATDDQSLQHFLSYSPWDDRAVMDHAEYDVSQRFADSPDTSLILDESSFAKKGRMSGGVARQWSGRQGKVDNCQVGVFAVLACGADVTLTDARLYLPKAWVEDPARCERAKIPPEERVYRTEPELAAAMVRHARRVGVAFGWVGADSLYGNDPAFLRALNADGEVFVADVKTSQLVYLEDPRPQLPPRCIAHGKAPIRPRAQVDPIRVDAWVRSQPESAWKRLSYRDSTQGPMTVEVLHRRVWLWDRCESQAHGWHLVVRRSLSSPDEVKYTLSNAPADTPTQRLAFLQGQRYWVERALQDAKSEVGMDQYQVRLWHGWHHHMAMVMMALLFMLEVRQDHRPSLPLLSSYDIRQVLSVLLPRANASFEEIYDQLEDRHRKRAAATESAQQKAKQKERLLQI